MKIGVVSDTHLKTVDDRLKQIVEVRFKDADMILHAGDVVAPAVLHYLEDFGAVVVQGNMDGAPLSHLPARRVITALDKRIGLTHGYGSPTGLAERLMGEFPGVDCLVYGHSHLPDNRRVDGVLLFNPGSASSPRSGRPPTVGLLHVDEGGVRGEIIII
jgi:hypothetical protein